MKYETLKHDGRLPLIGVNTFQAESPPQETTIALSRSTEQEKQGQIQRLHDFQTQHADAARDALEQLKAAVNEGGNGFGALMNAVRYCSLGQITDAFFEVGGQYRRESLLVDVLAGLLLLDPSALIPNFSALMLDVMLDKTIARVIIVCGLMGSLTTLLMRTGAATAFSSLLARRAISGPIALVYTWLLTC